MKNLPHALLCACLMLSVCRAETSWTDLQMMIGKAFGSEWTVSKDFDSIVAVRKDAKLLGTISRIDPIHLEGADPWDRALSSDYVISVIVRSKLTSDEYRDLVNLRTKLIASRMKGVPTNTKEAFGKRTAAEDAIELPDFFFGNYSVYYSCTAKRGYEVRPVSIVTCRDTVLEILGSQCSKY